jgi:DNA (cytosine-5)-methyltransferase 1
MWKGAGPVDGPTHHRNSARGLIETQVLDLLPTPAAGAFNDGESVEQWDARRERIKAKGINGNGMGEPLAIAAQRLLPTPRTSDTNGPGRHGTGGPDLRTVASELPLLQTPAVADGMGSRKARGGERSNEKLLPGQAVEMATDWGPYAPAIHRWERVLGRPAPAPTELNSKGGHRLSPHFCEWMMGVPDGWICDTDISRNEQLKAAGNGVVPQQATAALKDMLAAFGVETGEAAA